MTFALTLMLTGLLGVAPSTLIEPDEQREETLPMDLRPGLWTAWLDCPGGELPFGLELGRGSLGWHAWIVNGDERLTIPDVRLDGDDWVLEIDHYDARLSARASAEGGRLDGEYVKRRGPDDWARLAFHAVHSDLEGGVAWIAAERLAPVRTQALIDERAPSLDGRFTVLFSSDDVPAVGLFRSSADSAVSGTFMTTTGDYRFLAGRARADGSVRLSVFDGAHAFLFTASPSDDGSWQGDFWSGDWWHETWTAHPDPEARLPSGFELTRWLPSGSLSDLRFPDLDGRMRGLDDPAFAGQARILQVFGSWCPNCHDASDYLVELDERYGDRGLSIVGLAFEVSGEFERDAEQVRRYLARHGATYPVLVAGLADKDAASRALPVLDRVRSYPTTVFLHGDGRVRAVYSGFSGPATGVAHTELRAAFEALIQELLAESGPGEDTSREAAAGEHGTGRGRGFH